jgi:hypothetical protein
MHAFIGKGYNESFTKKMGSIIKKIRSEKKLIIVFQSDDICAECPHLDKNKTCNSEESTLLIDKKVISKFEIKEREYSTNEISLFMRKLTKEDFAYICSTCSWYPSGICEKKIFAPLLGTM